MKALFALATSLSPQNSNGISLSLITSLNMYFRSLINPYLGSIVRISCPNSCNCNGTFVENSAKLDTLAKGMISVVLKYIFF
tara:strand:- start:87 stop:332 length:246 start_codon:yes stop_codon:yes gene_type:complete